MSDPLETQPIGDGPGGLNLPPRARLAHVVQSLASALPKQLGNLLDAPRFEAGKAALARLAATAERAALAMTEAEAAWMAKTLLERWSNLAEPALAPFAAVVAPDEVWIGERPVHVSITAATVGVDGDWDAAWEGAVVAGPASKSALLVVNPPASREPSFATVRARIRAHSPGESGGPRARCLLLADKTIAARRPFVTMSEDGRRLVIADQSGEPAANVPVEIGNQTVSTNGQGLIELAVPGAPGALIRVHGIVAGRVKG